MLSQRTNKILHNFIITIALAHYHAAISIDIHDPITNEDNKREFQHYNNNSIGLSDLSNDVDVNPCALKKAHIKEAVACHEEAQRLQRMSRDLKVFSIFAIRWHLNILLNISNISNIYRTRFR